MPYFKSERVNTTASQESPSGSPWARCNGSWNARVPPTGCSMTFQTGWLFVNRSNDVPYRFGAQKSPMVDHLPLKKVICTGCYWLLWFWAFETAVASKSALRSRWDQVASATDPEALKGPRIGPGGFGSGGYCAGTSSGLLIGDSSIAPPFTAMIYNGWCWSFFFEEFIQIQSNPPYHFGGKSPHVPPKCPLSPGQALTGSQPAVFPQAMAAKPSIHACSFGNPPDPDKITTYPGVARRSLAHGDPKGMAHGALWDMLKWWWVKGGKVE